MQFRANLDSMHKQFAKKKKKIKKSDQQNCLVLQNCSKGDKLERDNFAFIQQNWKMKLRSFMSSILSWTAMPNTIIYLKKIGRLNTDLKSLKKDKTP